MASRSLALLRPFRQDDRSAHVNIMDISRAEPATLVASLFTRDLSASATRDLDRIRSGLRERLGGLPRSGAVSGHAFGHPLIHAAKDLVGPRSGDRRTGGRLPILICRPSGSCLDRQVGNRPHFDVLSVVLSRCRALSLIDSAMSIWQGSKRERFWWHTVPYAAPADMFCAHCEPLGPGWSALCGNIPTTGGLRLGGKWLGRSLTS